MGVRSRNFGRPFAYLALRNMWQSWIESSVRWPPRSAFKKKKEPRQNIMACHAYALSAVIHLLVMLYCVVTAGCTTSTWSANTDSYVNSCVCMSLSSSKQHLIYDVFLEVRLRGAIIRTVLCCIVYWSYAQS